MPYAEFGLVAIVAVLIGSLVWSRVSAARTIGKLRAELDAKVGSIEAGTVALDIGAKIIVPSDVIAEKIAAAKAAEAKQ